MNRQDMLHNIDLTEGMVLICTYCASSVVFTLGEEYKVTTNARDELGICSDKGRWYVWSVSKFTIKETLSFANTKIDLRTVNGLVDEEKSRAFQEACFKEGYSRGCGGKAVMHTDNNFIFVSGGTNIITYGGLVDGFLAHPFKEITFEYKRKLEYNMALKVDTVDDKLTDKEVKLNKVISDLEEQLAKAKKTLEEV